MHKFLSPIMILSLLAASLCAHADPVLTGEWRSDHDLTMAFLRANVKMSPNKEAFLDQLMGHLTLTITADKMISNMPDLDVKSGDKVNHMQRWTFESEYKVIYSNKYVIVETDTEPFTNKQTVAIINFVEPDVMWVYAGGADKSLPELHFREYFRRVRGNGAQSPSKVQ